MKPLAVASDRDNLFLGCKFQYSPHGDLTGQRFTRWIVLYFSHVNKYGRSVWKCRCDCGAIVGVQHNYLLEGRSRSCGCFRGISNKTRPKGKGPPNKLAPGEADKQRTWRRYVKRAKQKGFVWKLTFDEFIALLSADCTYCGAPPNCNRSLGDLNGLFPCNGIDRVDNTKGYVLSNCITACGACNKAKHTMSFRQFSAWARRIAARVEGWPATPPVLLPGS